jgi:hypothetical protein
MEGRKGTGLGGGEVDFPTKSYRDHGIRMDRRVPCMRIKPLDSVLL